MPETATAADPGGTSPDPLLPSHRGLTVVCAPQDDGQRALGSPTPLNRDEMLAGRRPPAREGRWWGPWTKAREGEPMMAHDLLRLATAGSVDDGDSTLVGRFLHDYRSFATPNQSFILSRIRGEPGVRGGSQDSGHVPGLMSCMPCSRVFPLGAER